jgi:hypothetical protein
LIKEEKWKNLRLSGKLTSTGITIIPFLLPLLLIDMLATGSFSSSIYGSFLYGVLFLELKYCVYDGGIFSFFVVDSN